MRVLTYKHNVWQTGCGCGGVKPQDVVTPPDNSKTIFVFHKGPLVGPVTGIEYDFFPTYNAIDVDAADAQAFINSGQATEWRQGHKGYTARVTSPASTAE